MDGTEKCRDGRISLIPVHISISACHCSSTTRSPRRTALWLADRWKYVDAEGSLYPRMYFRPRLRLCSMLTTDSIVQWLLLRSNLVIRCRWGLPRRVCPCVSSHQVSVPVGLCTSMLYLDYCRKRFGETISGLVCLFATHWQTQSSSVSGNHRPLSFTRRILDSRLLYTMVV